MAQMVQSVEGGDWLSISPAEGVQDMHQSLEPRHAAIHQRICGSALQMHTSTMSRAVAQAIQTLPHSGSPWTSQPTLDPNII